MTGAAVEDPDWLLRQRAAAAWDDAAHASDFSPAAAGVYELALAARIADVSAQILFKLTCLWSRDQDLVARAIDLRGRPVARCANQEATGVAKEFGVNLAVPVDQNQSSRHPDPLPGRGILHLVACVSVKRDRPAPARDLYASPWFRKARSFVEGNGGNWFILSAQHGLLSPDQVIPPYERTLNAMRVAERRAWAASVVEQFDEANLEFDRISVLAGKRYREFLMPALRARATFVDVPLAGLGIGQQLAWLGGRI